MSGGGRGEEAVVKEPISVEKELQYLEVEITVGRKMSPARAQAFTVQVDGVFLQVYTITQAPLCSDRWAKPTSTDASVCFNPVIHYHPAFPFWVQMLISYLNVNF